MYREDNQQLDFHSNLLEQLVPIKHTYRKLLKLVDFKTLSDEIKDSYSEKGRKSAYSIESSFKMLVLQQAEDYSDREMERFLRENNCAKYFCGFGLLDSTPDHSFFGKFRQRVGVDRITKIFNAVVKSLRNQNIVSDCFTFIDATAVISKANLWEERDKALSDKEKTLNNENIEKYSTDPDARIGCKGSNKYWYGYKRSHAVDAKHGVIKAIDVAPANPTDAKQGVNILPPSGMVLADKGYDTDDFQAALSEKGLHSGVIQKNNRKSKNKYLDQWLTKLRSPFEGLFNHADKCVRYIRGLDKVTFHQTLDALAQNFKTLVNIEPLLLQQGIRVS